MTLAIDYNGAPIGYDVPPTKVAMPQRAELGAISMGSISPEDPTAALTLVGHKPIAITESACSQQRLFTGWTVERNMGRSFEQSQFVGADPLIHDTTIVDLNAAFGFRIITWTDGKRPEESVDDRLAWLLTSNYLAGPDGELVGDTGKVKTGFSLMMDAVDYRGSYPADVLADLSQRYATPINYFAYWDYAPVTGHGVARPGLFFDYISEGRFDCTISISNLVADTYTGDVPKTTCFAPITESRLERSPDQVYSDVIVNYSGGSCYRINAATATAFIKRGTSISRPHIGKLATAQAAGDAWLAQHNVETDRITTTIHVPRTVVGLIQAGMRMQVKFTHLTDYTAFTWMRIVACTPRPVDDLARYYDVDLELVSPQAAAGCVGATPSGFYPPIDTLCVDGIESDATGNVYYARPGDVYADVPTPYNCGNWHFPLDSFHTVWLGTPLGWASTAEAWPPNSIGMPVVGGGTATIYLVGGGWTDGAWAVNHREPGLPTYITDSSGTIPGPVSGVITIVVTVPGNEEEICNHLITVWLGVGGSPLVAGFAGFDWVTESTPTGDNIPIVSNTQTTTDPTVNDDVDAGYAVNSTWINTSSGEAFVLVDNTAGAAVWVSTTATAGGAPTDADYLVGTAQAGLSAEIVVGTTPGGELGGTWASPTVDGTHSGSAHLLLGSTSTTAAAGDHTHPGGELLVADVPAGSPLIFGDILQNEAQDDLVYGG